MCTSVDPYAGESIAVFLALSLGSDAGILVCEQPHVVHIYTAAICQKIPRQPHLAG